MKKIIRFNSEGFKKSLQQKHLKMIDVQRFFGYSNNTQIKKWLEGSDIYLSKACEFCSEYGLDLMSTFVIDQNGEEIQSGPNAAEKSQNAAPVESKAQEYDLESILQLIEQARDKERRMYTERLDQERERYEAKLKELGMRYEKMMLDKNESILKEQKRYNDAILQVKEMEMRNEELTRQYQELELKNKSYNPIGCAESHGYLKK